MLLPWGTDAPLYHRPYATVAMIALCVVSFFVFPAVDHEEWMLEIGNGVHPLQWVTNLFMHAGRGHLIGNMAFLWVFGIIVEGKIGWWAFTLVYLGIGIAESAATQLVFNPEETVYMLGASGAISGLLAICLVWAPRNDVHCLAFFRIVPSNLDLSVLWFVAFYICLDCLEFALDGFSISGAMAHLGGTVLGFGIGALLLKRDLVDCENWDLFAVMAGRHGDPKKAAQKRQATTVRPMGEKTRLPGNEPRKKKTAKKSGRKPVKSIEDKSAAALRTLRLHLEMGEIEAALSVYKTSRGRIDGWQPQESDWLDLIGALTEQDDWGEAAHVMRDYCRTVSAPAPRVRLKLAQVLIQKLSRPAQGLEVLREIPDGALSAKLEPLRDRLTEQAEHMREEGELELKDELW
jgi:membrane associated rhomboid family serine protease